MGMDISGAAIGTVIANMIIIPPCVIHMMKSKNLRLSKENLKPDWKYNKKIISLGAPAAISQAFTSLAFLIINGRITLNYFIMPSFALIAQAKLDITAQNNCVRL